MSALRDSSVAAVIYTIVNPEKAIACVFRLLSLVLLLLQCCCGGCSRCVDVAVNCFHASIISTTAISCNIGKLRRLRHHHVCANSQRYLHRRIIRRPSNACHHCIIFCPWHQHELDRRRQHPCPCLNLQPRNTEETGSATKDLPFVSRASMKLAAFHTWNYYCCGGSRSDRPRTSTGDASGHTPVWSPFPGLCHQKS